MKYDLGTGILVLWLVPIVAAVALLVWAWLRAARPAVSSWAEIEGAGGGA